MKFNDFFDKKLIRNTDFGILFSTLMLICIGMLAIASATHITNGGSIGNIKIQFVAFIIGTIAIAIITVIDYNTFGDFERAIYIICILMLISVLFLGSNIKGSQSWIKFGPVNFQPSEAVKIGFIIAFAKHLEKRKEKLNTIVEVLPSLFYAALPIAIIMLQPDFGTALVFAFIVFFMLFAAGLNYKLIIASFGVMLASIPVMWFGFFKPYQKDRILTFLNPELDPMGSGYHVIQSKIAIGSGQIFGKGLFHGTQNNLGFIPERHTDFIFSVIGEELGLVGCVVILCLFLWLLSRIIHIAKVAKDDYGMLICVGIMAMFLFHILENVGMTIQIMPVTGIPLPFISYGGSSLLTNMAAIGVVLNIGMRRQVIRF